MNIELCFLGLLTILSVSCNDSRTNQSKDNSFRYTALSRLTDPGENADMLDDIPTDVKEICDIANVQLVHYRMLSQWKIPRTEWNTAFADHNMKVILDTLRAKGPGELSKDRKLQDRVRSDCTKEAIFLTSLLRSKNIPSRIRVGYLTNLYKGNKALEFWKNVKEYERLDFTSEYPDSFTLNAIEVNRSIEHWVTEYWDKKTNQWRLLDMRPEYLQAHGYEVDYHIKEKENFEYAWQVWKRRNDEDFEESAYAERGWSARTHIRYQLLMDFYSLLNHDGPGIFESNGKQTDQNDNWRAYMEKNYDELTTDELTELDNLAELISKNPSVDQLIDFYNNCKTMKINSIEEDKYSFIYMQRENTAANKK